MMIEVGKTVTIIKASIDTLLFKTGPPSPLLQRLSPNVRMYIGLGEQQIAFKGVPAFTWTWRFCRWYLQWQQLGRPPLRINQTIIDDHDDLCLRVRVECQSTPLYVAITKWRCNTEGTIHTIHIDRLIPPTTTRLPWLLRRWVTRSTIAEEVVLSGRNKID